MGYRTNKCIALGMVRANFLAVGTELEVDVYGRRHKAIVQEDAPLWDPSNERIKA
jgi:dimethylglycine dehydrogenase